MERLLPRPDHVAALRAALRRSPVVLLLGARQVGKTTLARSLAEGDGPVTVFDLEDPRDRARLSEPMLALEPLRGLVVMDEIHHLPGLFSLLRVLADRPGDPARFLLLGSASPELLRQGSESLAGRITFYRLPGFGLDEIGADMLPRLWLRGGFPRSYLAGDDAASAAWRRDFIATYLERDLVSLGVRVPAETLRRFWTMIAHYHGQVWNGAELSRAFGVSYHTVRKYLDLLTATFLIRQLPPWSENARKRLVKSPKVYVSDSGLLHTLLGLEVTEDLMAHPKIGASWEGLLLDQILRRLRARADQCHFWATHGGAELDLLVVAGNARLGFEIKRTDAPRITPSMRSALVDLRLDRLDVVHAGRETYPLAERVRAVAAGRILEDLEPS